jgi:hypothetical protein
MLSPKNHIRGECMRDTTEAGGGNLAVQPNKKAGARPAFSVVRLQKAKISTSRSQGRPSGS